MSKVLPSEMIEKRVPENTRTQTELLTVRECATMLHLSERTLYVWIHQNRLPYYKFGKVVRFKRRDIFRWLAKQKVTDGQSQAAGK